MDSGLRRMLSGRLYAIVIAFVVLVAATDGRILRRQTDSKEHKVWTGQTITLDCGDQMPDMFRRFWRKENNIISAANVVVIDDERFSVINNSISLVLQNATLDDVGEYTCTVNSRPRYQRTIHVEVVELVCTLPESPSNGGIEADEAELAESFKEDEGTLHDEASGTPVQNRDVFRFGSKIRYYCNKGFALIGPEVRVCSEPSNRGWTGQTPVCERKIRLKSKDTNWEYSPALMADLRNRMEAMEGRLHMSQPGNKGIAKLEEKMSTIESRMTSLESDADAAARNLERIQGLDASLHRVQLALNTNLHGRDWEKVLGIPVARLGARDGHIISEFTWIIEGIDDKIEQHRAEKFPYLESPSFYTNVPGYKFQLHVYPDDGNSGYIGAYAIPLQGEFDDFIAWPFTSKFELQIVSRDENEVTSDVVVPSRVPACNFGKPLPDNTIGCGFSRFMSHEDLKNKEKLYRFGKDILLKITIFLDYH